MFRPTPVPTANLYLQQKWDMLNYELHLFNLKHMKTTIDDSPPVMFAHLFIRPKKIQAEMERASEIQRNNRFMVEKFAAVPSTIDNKNYHTIKSLLTHKRQSEMRKLQHANKTMLERLRDTNSNYNRNMLLDEFEMLKKQSAMMHRYPIHWTQAISKFTKYRRQIRKQYVYPRAGRWKKPKCDDGKDKVPKSTASGRPGSRKISKKWEPKKRISSKKKTAQKAKKDAPLRDSDAEKNPIREDKKDESQNSGAEKKPAQEDEKDASRDSDVEKKSVQKDEKDASWNSDAEKKTIREDEKDESRDSDAEKKSVQEDEKDESQNSDAEKKTIREDEKDESRDSDTEKKSVQEDEKDASRDSDAEKETLEDDISDASLDSNVEKKTPK